MAWIERQAHRGEAAAEIESWFRDQGLVSHAWSNAPGDTYAQHEHRYHKTLVCVSGSITFHTPGEDLPLQAGDRMELPPDTAHAATVGPEGVTCIEAART